MARTLESLRKRMDSAESLYAVVRIMKSVAGMNIREYEHTVAALADYDETVALGFNILLTRSPIEVEHFEAQSRFPAAFVLLGSDQGLVGLFNQRLAEHADAVMAGLSPDPHDRLVLCAGRRLSELLRASGHSIADTIGMPGSRTGIGPTVEQLAVRLESWRSTKGVQSVALLYNCYVSPTEYQPRTRHLLPVDPHWLDDAQSRQWQPRTLPTFDLDWEQLLESLVREYLFVSLFRAVAESVTSENASRLSSMEAAERNIEERLGDLQQEYQGQRQRSITGELLDIVSSFETLGG